MHQLKLCFCKKSQLLIERRIFKSFFLISTVSKEQLWKKFCRALCTQSKIDLGSPYGNEPSRHPAFKINKEQPFNGEPPPTLLKQSFITPNELHFIRNRLPVPDINVREKLLFFSILLWETLCTKMGFWT